MFGSNDRKNDYEREFIKSSSSRNNRECIIDDNQN
jgi:hypothetical protein